MFNEQTVGPDKRNPFISGYLRDAQTIFSQLERGQAEGALSGYLQQLFEPDVQRYQFSVQGLVLSRRALLDYLLWLGLSRELCDVLADRAGAGISLSFSGDAYGKCLPDGRFERSADAQELADALRARVSTNDPLCLRVPDQPRLSEITFYIALDLQRLKQFAHKLAVLAVIGGNEDTLSQGELQEVGLHIADRSSWMVVFEAGAAGEADWIKAVGRLPARFRLPQIQVAQDAPVEIPEWLASPQSAFRKQDVALWAGIRMIWLAQAAEEYHTRVTGQTRMAMSREERASRRLDIAGNTNSSRDEFDSVRFILKQEVEKIAREIEEQNRKALLPNGRLNRPVAEALEALSSKDIEMEPGYSAIKLSLSKSFQEQLLKGARKELKDQLRDDVYVMKTGMENCHAQIKSQLELITGDFVSIRPEVISEREGWDRIREGVLLELSYSSEMPKRGFLQRLAESKSTVFIVLSVLSLAGPILGIPSFRKSPTLQLLLVIVFVIALVYSFKKWKHEDTEKLQKEVERIRSQVSSEAKRLIGELQRDKKSYLNAQLEQMQKEYVRQIEFIQKAHQAVSAEKTVQRRHELRDKLKALEQKNRDFQPLLMQLSKLKLTAQDFVRDSEKQLAAAVKEAK
jgi:hypothetical protein